MKYNKLDEIRTKHWSSLSGPNGNNTDVLIAFEVVSELPVLAQVTLSEANKVWANAIGDAKNVIREIHSELVGFDPHRVLEMTRRLYLFRCMGARNTASPLYWNLNESAMKLIEKPEFMDDALCSEAVDVATTVINIKRNSLAGYVGIYGTREYHTLVEDCGNELSDRLGHYIKSKTSRELAQMYSYASNVIALYLNTICLCNSFNFRGFSDGLVELFISEAIKATLSDEINFSVLCGAIKELVEY